MTIREAKRKALILSMKLKSRYLEALIHIVTIHSKDLPRQFNDSVKKDYRKYVRRMYPNYRRYEV